MALKKLLGIVALMGFVFFTKLSIAADSVAKEETNPPPAEGALTLEQIPPISLKGAKPVPNTVELSQPEENTFASD